MAQPEAKANVARFCCRDAPARLNCLEGAQDNMLTLAMKRGYFRAGLALASLAWVALIAPPVAVTFGHGKNALHCLTQNHNGVTRKDAVHSIQHQHGTRIPDEAPAKGDHGPTCCKIFCLAALTPNSGSGLNLSWPADPVFSLLKPIVSGRGTNPPDHPPKSSLPLLTA